MIVSVAQHIESKQNINAFQRDC